MIKKIISIICMFLIVTLIPVSAQLSQTVIGGEAGGGGEVFGNPEDNDDDGVCNEARSYYSDRDIGLLSNIGCTITSLGDLCAGTPKDEEVYKGGDRSGCSESQLVGFSNYWKLRLGEIRPKTVKVNWLTDQKQGIKVYQPVSLVQNIEYTGREESIKFKDINVRCDDGRGVIRTKNLEVPDVNLLNQEAQGGAKSLETLRDGVSYVDDGSYGSVTRSDLNKTDLDVDLVIRLNQQPEELVRPKSVTNLKGGYGIDEIEFRCTATINQCREQFEDVDGVRTVKGCSGIYPPETDEFFLIVPIDSVTIQAPEFLLQSGIDSADAIADFADSLIKPLEKLYSIVSKNCVAAITIVLGGKALSFIWEGFNKAADFVWFGPKGAGIYNEAFIISGRTMCAMAVCPRAEAPGEKEWCKFLDYQPSGSKKTLGELSTKDGRPVPIQNSLILSTGCLCTSGLLANMYKLNAIALKWKECLLRASDAGEFIGECDRYLKEGICEFVINEIETWDGFSFIGNIFDIGGIGNTEERKPAVATREVGQALNWRGRADNARDNAKDFFDDELIDIARAGGKGILGYEQHALARTFCSLALYRTDFLDASSFYSSDLRRVSFESSTSANFDSDIAYFGEGGRPVYGYKISWMIVAGRENLRYNIYMENDLGTRRPIYRSSLAKIGDFDSDYIEITDDIDDYTKICFELSQENRRLRCYPPGGGSDGGLFDEDLALFGEEEINDKDKDRLPDEWEIRFNCDKTVVDSITIPEDKIACQELIDNGAENKLNLNNPDSDGDRVDDGSEDPDKDGYNNYQEYRRSYNPNSSTRTIQGGTVQSNCLAEFTDFEIIGGEDIIGINSVAKKFELGDKISLRLNGLQLLQGSRDVSEDDILIVAEIGGPRLFSSTDETLFNDARNEFDILNIPTGRGAPSTGIYDLKVQLITPRSFVGGDICRDLKGKLAEKTKKILIFNPSDGSCIDSDKGDNYNVGGVCVDSSGVHTDSCNSNQVSDFYCRNGACVSETQSCSGGNVCREGGCTTTCFDNDPENLIGAFGVCKDESGVKTDECVQNGVKEYQCASGSCEELVKTCTSCEQNSIRVDFPLAEITDRRYNVGVCTS